ncbi:MAG: glycosyltransferase family 4 protein [Candidatus Cloacimonetes bacterium]|nr:glycosyltransferase family 4 protein [Candidatus Cloacimonadota bacterium]
MQHGKTGLLIPPDNPPALAAAVIRFYNEKDDG